VTHLIERFTEILKKGKYNAATIAAYRKDIFVFYNHFREYPQSKITEEVIATYLTGLADNKLSKTDVIQVGRALKLFYQVIFNKTLNIKSNGNPKEETQIESFSQEEITQLFANIKNIKHKLLLLLVYNSGLKTNEIIHLEVTDVDTVNQCLHIRNKKKSRILRLSPNVNDLIRSYLLKYNPTKIFFPGSGGDGYYSARNIQLFFQKILVESGIKKQATLNTLRHSFAIHSLEQGLDLHILKKIMGHNNIQTTSLYLPYANVELKNIRTPLESLEI
jgi:integrase/recombinase XerD